MGRRREKPDLTPVLNLPWARLAQRTAARIGFTVRRWRRDEAQAVLHIEVERRLVGAPPVVAELRVPIPRLPVTLQRTPKRTVASVRQQRGLWPERVSAPGGQVRRVRET